MSLQINILASFASQIYVALIGVVLVPMYITYMGAEAYGLVGFFAMLQAWFNLLDIGLTATVARETARYCGGATHAIVYRQLVRALESIFLAVALVGCIVLLAASGYIARDWLRAAQLSQDEVLTSIRLMAVIMAMRWMAGLYRGAIGGAERMVWLSSFNAAIATLRFGGILPVLMFVGTSPTLFFGFQLAVALLELLVLGVYAYRFFPPVQAGTRLAWDWTPVKPILRFSLTIAFTSSVWVLVTQSDKLVLSRILSLADYGYFTLAVLIASGIMVLSGPVGSAIMPRMAKLDAEGNHGHLIEVYRRSTQLVAVVAGSAAITVAFGAEALLWAWTGDAELARKAAPVLTLYAAGNGILAVSAFPYYLQFAKGDLHLHLIGNAVFVVLLVPLVIWAATEFGAVGAGCIWLGTNLLLFVAWLPLVHRRFQPGLNARWYLNDVAVIVAAATSMGYVASRLLPPGGSRLGQFADILLAGTLVLAAGAAASSAVRLHMGRLWRNRSLKQA